MKVVLYESILKLPFNKKYSVKIVSCHAITLSSLYSDELKMGTK